MKDSHFYSNAKLEKFPFTTEVHQETEVNYLILEMMVLRGLIVRFILHSIMMLLIVISKQVQDELFPRDQNSPKWW